MSEGPLPPLGRIDRSQGPWDTRNVAELSQTSFRTTLRGFDRNEVRAILDSIAADYRVLQLQNASLLRQLADLEGVLQAYRRDEGTVTHALQKANDEARAILMRAQAQAEETMARVNAMVRGAESPLAPIENGHGNIQVTLASTVSEMLAILNTAERSRFEFGTRQQPSAPVMSDVPRFNNGGDHRIQTGRFHRHERASGARRAEAGLRCRGSSHRSRGTQRALGRPRTHFVRAS